MLKISSILTIITKYFCYGLLVNFLLTFITTYFWIKSFIHEKITPEDRPPDSYYLLYEYIDEDLHPHLSSLIEADRSNGKQYSNIIWFLVDGLPAYITNIPTPQCNIYYVYILCIHIFIAKDYTKLLSFPQNKAINDQSKNLVRTMLVTEPSYTTERMEAIGTGTVPQYFKVPNNGYKSGVVSIFLLYIVYYILCR